jgi:hypothetical protein
MSVINVAVITTALSTYQSTGATLFMPWFLSTLARAYAKLGQKDAKTLLEELAV